MGDGRLRNHVRAGEFAGSATSVEYIERKATSQSGSNRDLVFTAYLNDEAIGCIADEGVDSAKAQIGGVAHQQRVMPRLSGVIGLIVKEYSAPQNRLATRRTHTV